MNAKWNAWNFVNSTVTMALQSDVIDHIGTTLHLLRVFVLVRAFFFLFATHIQLFTRTFYSFVSMHAQNSYQNIFKISFILTMHARVREYETLEEIEEVDNSYYFILSFIGFSRLSHRFLLAHAVALTLLRFTFSCWCVGCRRCRMFLPGERLKGAVSVINSRTRIHYIIYLLAYVMLMLNWNGWITFYNTVHVCAVCIVVDASL